MDLLWRRIIFPADSTRSGRYQRILAAVAAAAVGKGSSLVVNLIAIPVLVRYLGAEEYGLWVTITTMTGMLIILDIGIANTLTNLISEAYATNDRNASATYFATAFWTSLGIVSAIGVLVFSVWRFIDWSYLFHIQNLATAPALSNAMLVAVGIFLLGIPLGLSAKVMAGYQELHTANLLAAACNGISLVAVLVLVSLHATLPWLVGTSIGAPVFANLVGLGWIFFTKPWISLHPRRIQRSVIPRIFHSGSQFFVIQIAGLVVFNSDNLIISHYLGPAQVTPYSLIWRIVGYAILIQNMVNPALWPAYSEAYARGDLAWIRSAYGKLRKGTLVSLTIGCLVLIPFGQLIIRVWAGRSAVPSQTLIVLMCVWMILIAMTRNQGTLLGATSRMRGQAIAAGIASAVNLALSIVWVRPFGTIGVLLATIATYLVFVCTVQTWGVWSIFHRSREGARLYVAAVGFNWRKSVIRRCRRSMRYCFWGVLHVVAFLRPKNQRQTTSPRRILLVNGAHLGDVVISTGLLPVLRSAFPDAEIGFATASWAHAVIGTHPDITYTHTIDQWKLNRSNVGFWKKWIQYRRSRARLLRELRERQYDWAICLHLWSPDCLDLAWLAGIPVRAAFAHSHMAPLATHRVRYPHEMSFMTAGACQAELLRALGVQPSHLRLRKASIPVTQDGLEELKSILPCPDMIPAGYCVVHMGAGAPVRELPSSFWRTIVQSESQSLTVVLTGKGKRDAEQIARVTKGMTNCVSVCDALSWKGFVSAIRHARKVYSVDTVAMHVAAAVGTPCSAVCTGISGVGRWRPEGEQVTVWANHVPCAPCERPNGCPEMSCLKGIYPEDLLNSSRQHLALDALRSSFAISNSVEHSLGFESGPLK